MVARQQAQQEEQGPLGRGVGKVVLEEMPSESSSTTTASSSAQYGDAVRLRVASGGSFVTEKGGRVKYVGGSSYLDRIPSTFKFADLSHRLAEKANGAVLVRFQVPGEPLDEDELVSVQDDLDIQEMYEEAARAVQQALGKPPRLRLFLTPAMEEDMTPEQYQDGNDFFSHAQDQDQFWVGLPGGGPGGPVGAAGKKTGLEHASSGHSSFSTAQPALAHSITQTRRAGAQLGIKTKAASKALQTHDAWPPELAYPDGDRTPEDCGVTTPDCPLEELRLYGSWDRGGRSGAAFHLPSHISAFGDGLHLPSYISAFGDGARSEDRAPFEHGVQELLVQQAAYEVQNVPGDVGLPVVVQGELQAQGLHRTLSNLKPVFRSVPHVPRSAVKVLGTIAEGSFGEVSLAKTQQFGELAVKWLKCGKYDRHLEHFWQEADLLAQLNHPNVLRLYGVVTASQQDPSVVGIMTEYVRGGSLSANLRTFTSPLPLRFRAQLALQVAQGMSYLHECNIVHFDLKPDNLLLDTPIQASLMYEASCHCTLKVADFGLSKEKQRSFVSGVHDLRGTLPFMAPELVNTPERINEKADCWSFGMLLWELLTLQSPFQELAPNHIIAGLMRGTLRPEIPVFCEQPWMDLMAACWALNPTQRPSFAELAQQLEDLVDVC